MSGDPIKVTLHFEGLKEVYAAEGFSVSHATNALRKLLRLLVEAGSRGKCEVYDKDGKLRFTIGDIEKAAQKDIQDNDSRFGLVKFHPFEREFPVEV